jgi:hypothetical protein
MLMSSCSSLALLNRLDSRLLKNKRRNQNSTSCLYFVCLEDAGSNFLRNISDPLQDYKAVRQKFLLSPVWGNQNQRSCFKLEPYCRKTDRLCGLVGRVPGYRTQMYCVSCEVLTEFIYVM